MAQTTSGRDLKVSKVVEVKSTKSFFYIDTLPDGTVRVAYTPDMVDLVRAMRDKGILWQEATEDVIGPCIINTSAVGKVKLPEEFSDE